MGHRCMVEGCRNVAFKTRKNDKTVKYHSFPKNEEMRLKWIKALRRSDDWVPDNTSYVCSEHFQSTDFERDLKAELLNLPPKKILKPEAVPTLNLPKTNEETNVRWRKSRNSSSENKENVTADNLNVSPGNGFVISYLGIPRLFITSGSKTVVEGCTASSNYSNQSRIIPLEPYHSFGTKSNITNPNCITSEATNSNVPRNVFKLDELCRLCGSYSNRMTPIYDNAKCNFSELIENHFPEIKIRRDDILPVQICFKCDNSLISWYQFYKTSNTVNRRFQSILRKLVPEPEKVESATKEATDLSNTMQPSRFENETLQYEELEMNCDNESDIREIEIVEVSPEAYYSDALESVLTEEKYDVGLKEEKYVPFEMEDEFSHSETEEKREQMEEERFDSSIYPKDLLENVNVSDSESILLSDSSPETTRTSSQSFRIKKDTKLAGVIRRRRKRRLPSLNLRRMCHICGKIFKYPESLRRHLKTVHSDERPFKCHLCTSSFNRNHNLTIHIKVVHQRQRVYVKKHVPRLCDYCGKVLLSARSLDEHISSIHTKKALYECNKCHSTFYRKLTFDKHRQSDECDDRNPKKCNAPKVEEVFLKYCDICGLEFKKEHFYLKHKFKHMNSFMCSVCSMKFEDGSVLKDHVDSEHPEIKPFECEVCGKKFKNKPLLNCHMIIHNGEKRYQCQYCSLKFLKKKYLSTHILTHTGERPFVCTICGKGFKQSGDMRKHKATHIRKQI